MKKIDVKINNGIAFITVNRPEVLNALNIDTVNEIKGAFRECINDDNVGVVVFTGAGEKAFIAGGDIKEMSPLNSLEGVEFARRGQDLTLFIESFPKPVIAAVNGYALGGGCELALACHIRIASENATFGQPEVGLGLIPGWGGTQRLPRLVGKGKAIEIITTGDMISAIEAKEMGLANSVVPLKELIPTTIKIAKSILKRSPIAVKLSLEAINNGMEMTLEKGLEYEASQFGIAFSTLDKKEGTQAFIEKRKPRFKGE